MRFVAQHLREIMAQLGFRKLTDMVGRVDMLEPTAAIDHWICGISVKPGDLVLADEVGVCFVPHERAADVLAVVRRILQYEEQRLRQIAEGTPVPELARAPRK
jgi:hypothetical protein